MPKLWRSLLGRTEERADPQVSVDQWLEMFNFQGLGYALTGTTTSADTESIENSFIGYINGLYKTNGIVFACMEVRRSLFSEARFQWQRINKGRPGDLFGTRELDILDTPWPNGTTGELLSRAIQDADLSGNHYVVREAGRLRRLRPDWVQIILTAPPDQAVESDVAGYIYYPGGILNNPDIARLYTTEEMAHWSPIPDPEAQYRGMSWLTPILREVQADKQATEHKAKYLANGATPKLSVSLKETVTRDQFIQFIEAFEAANGGIDNAYKCLHPSTDVAMWDGTRRAAGLVVPGDRVVAWSGGRAVPGTVSDAQWQAPSPIVTVTTQRGRVIKTNDRHPFLARRVVRKYRQYLSGEQWVEAADLLPGDLLTTGLGWASDDAPDMITPYQAWILGALVGDGSLAQSTPVISAWDAGIRDRFKISHTLNSTGKGHDYRVLGIRSLCVESGIMGKRSWEKRIPESVMTGSLKVKSAFMSGLIDTDGHVTDPEIRGSADVGITSTSHGLLMDAQHVLASMGVNASVSLSMSAGREGKGVKGRDAWRLNAMGNVQAVRLHEILDLACAEKSRRLSVYADTPSRDDRSRMDRVVSVEISSPEPTIGLEIAEHHTHVTGGVVTHNTLYLGGGADVSMIGANMQQLDFKQVQGAGESRIAAAAGVPSVVVGFSEGMQGSSLNAGNYKTAKESLGDRTLRPLWRSVSASYQSITRLPRDPRTGTAPVQGTVRLWYDDRDIAFLRTDRLEASKIMTENSASVIKFVQGGFTPESSVAAVNTGDLTLLQHTGLVSVQLLPPGQTPPGSGGEPAPEPPALPPGEKTKELPPPGQLPSSKDPQSKPDATAPEGG